MGHAVSEVARKLLTDGIHTYYPCEQPDQDPRTRFEICQRVTCREEYLITDKDLQIHVTIPRAKLEDQTFDLVGWYIEFLSQKELYYPSQTRSNSVDSRAGSLCCPHDHLYVGCSQPDSEDQNSGAEGLTDHSDQVEADVYSDLPDLEPVADDEVWDGSYVSDDENEDPRTASTLPDEVIIIGRLAEVLVECQPYPVDGTAVDVTYQEGDNRFVITKRGTDLLEIYDRVQGFEAHISMRFVQWQTFSVG